MSTWGFLPGIIIMTFAVTSQAATITPVIDSFTLTDLIEDNSVKVLEIRSDKGAYLTQHIPGSVHLSYEEFRGPKTNPGQLPELSKLAQALGSRGIQVENAVVIVHDGVTTTDFGTAARVYWTLKSVGFESLTILNGGFRAYQKDGFELVSGETKVSPVKLTLVFNPFWYADTAEVAKQVAGDDSARLLDARLDDFYAGTAWHDVAARPGILPGADQFAFEAFFDKNTPLLKHNDEIDSIVGTNGLNQPGTISYCNTGHWAAINWFVLSELARVDDVKLYPESMVEWSALNKPMENVPTSVLFAILKTKKWLNSLVN